MSLKYALAERSRAQITAPKWLEKQASQASLLLVANFSQPFRLRERIRRLSAKYSGSAGVKTGLEAKLIDKNKYMNK